MLYVAGDGSIADRNVWLEAHKSTRAAHPVRIIEFRVAGTTRALLASEFDLATLSVRDIAATYARRWDIAMAVVLLKRHLNHNMFGPHGRPSCSRTCSLPSPSLRSCRRYASRLPTELAPTHSISPSRC